ncbi:hypothetical protein ACFQ5N_09505 [Lutibacter holmesii]|uniref:Uncharacterized protein n=1 Tax=Lutibacter holmesii TaxID=1137985 RepID=A0ABW3WPA2_9FLAO
MKLNNNNIDKTHSKELGFSTPNNYFETSKNEIFHKVSVKNKPKRILLNKTNVVWLAAASIALLITFTLIKPTTFSSLKNVPTIVSDSLHKIQDTNLMDQYFSSEDNIILTSLFVDDENIDNYVAQYIVEDILIDEYIDSYIVDEMMNDELIFQ